MKYCKYCGKQRPLLKSNRFDEETGEAVTYYGNCADIVCISNVIGNEAYCESHGGHEYTSSLFSLFFVCRKCGLKIYSD